MTVIAAMDRPLARAMRANVLIERSGGLAALGGKAIGSGVILELSGGSALIVTNRHVVDDDYPDSGLDVSDPLAVRQLGRVTVKLLGPAAGNGQVVWLAPGNVDLALVRSNVPPASQAQPARWRKGRTVKVGASVFAIGNPHNFGWSHTQGVVSQLRVQETKTAKIHVNPGNSGGGLYDQDGYLLGINSWGVDKSTSEGLNFAIALDDLLAAVPASILGREASDPDDGGHTRP
jgi:serine protease Do